MTLYTKRLVLLYSFTESTTFILNKAIKKVDLRVKCKNVGKQKKSRTAIAFNGFSIQKAFSAGGNSLAFWKKDSQQSTIRK